MVVFRNIKLRRFSVHWGILTFGSYATAWELLIYRLWIGIRKPRYWLFSSQRKESGYRSWFYWWPGFIRIIDKKDLV